MNGAGIDAPCQQNGDCRSGSCSSLHSVCVSLCQVSRPNCPDGARCAARAAEDDLGFCRKAPQVTGFLPCQLPWDCALGGLCYPEDLTGIPGGACVMECSPESGGTCSTLEKCLNDLYCFTVCSVPDDCPSGRVCHGGVCRVWCASDGDCQSGHCNLYDGYCYDGSPLTGLGLDAACTKDEECKSSYCSPETSKCLSFCRISRPNCPEEVPCARVTENDDRGECHK